MVLGLIVQRDYTRYSGYDIYHFPCSDPYYLDVYGKMTIGTSYFRRTVVALPVVLPATGLLWGVNFTSTGVRLFYFHNLASTGVTVTIPADSVYKAYGYAAALGTQIKIWVCGIPSGTVCPYNFISQKSLMNEEHGWQVYNTFQSCKLIQLKGFKEQTLACSTVLPYELFNWVLLGADYPYGSDGLIESDVLYDNMQFINKDYDVS